MHPCRLALLALLALLLGMACGGPLKLTMLDANAARPSNVAVFFTVDTQKGEPVPGLTAEQFRIYEDEQAVSILESRQRILNQEVAATHSTLLLIDMSGSVTGSGDVPVIIEAAQSFAQRVEKYEKVAVYGFDGSPQLYQLVGFSTGPGVAAGIARLGSFKPRDPSTNLNGAVVEALHVLDHRLASVDTPLSFGTLVIFTDGTDRAHRVKRADLHKELDARQHLDILVIGVGAEIDEHELSSIGTDGTILSKD